MSDRKAVIKNADMSEEMQQDAVDCATQVSQGLKGLPTMLWIRIRIDPHHSGNLDPHPDPHKIKIRIRIKTVKLDPDLHHLADVKLKCIFILAFLEGFEAFL
jgi:hypothetical protein